MIRDSKPLSLLLLISIFLLLTCCDKSNILIIYPKADEISTGQIDLNRVCQAYRSAINELFQERVGQYPFSDINIYFSDESQKFYQEMSKDRVAAIKKYSSLHDIKIIIYAEIIQTDKTVPFYSSKIHLYVADSGIRSHQSKRIMMDNKTFYALEYWEFEFREIFDKIIGVI